MVAIAEVNISSHLCLDQRAPDFVDRVKAAVGRIEALPEMAPSQIRNLEVSICERLFGCHERVSFVFAEDRLLQVKVVTDKEAQ